MIKKHIAILFQVFITIVSNAQNPALKVQKYVLDNGFTVFLNEDRTAKEVYGAVVVKAGSKNDPADATGMAHYLEHLLFKGTNDLGTTDYALEKPFLDSINIYYDMLGQIKDPEERKRIQQLINNQSVQASKFALPTEFDKLVQSIGGTGLNAFTTDDMTVYHNAFPGEQIEKWLDLYSHRFQDPVFRSFQSELEVVYEEKNMGMDGFQTRLIEEINKHLFKYHPYGTQTTIGTVEHLKNPSLTKMYNYFNTYYVANNMALVLCGNFDAEKALPMIREKFSGLRSAKVPDFPKYPETVFKKKEVLEVKYTPVKIDVIGYKTVPNIHPDKAALEVFVNLMFNEAETGKLNKLQREGKFMYSGGFNYSFNDDGAVIFFIVPKLIGQSFSKAEKLLFNEMNKIKKGELSDTDLLIIKTELYRQRQEDLESYSSRTFSIVQSFGEGSAWEDYLKYSKELEAVTKEDVMRVARHYFGDNYFALHSKRGSPKKETLEKPGFKPVVTDQKGESAYAKKFNSTITTNESPIFLDFKKDAYSFDLNESNKMYHSLNPINDVFTLEIQFRVGKDSLKNLDFAADLFNYFHTKDLSTDQMKEAFAMLGLTYSAYSTNQRFVLSFKGLDANLQKSLKLINQLIYEPVADEKSFKVVRNEEVTGRKIMFKDPGTMGYVLYEYAKYGERSSYVDRVSSSELKKIKVDELMAQYRKAVSYNAVWHYVGKESPESIKALMIENLKLSNNRKQTPLAYNACKTSPENIIYFINDKKAIQSQVYFHINSNNYTSAPEVDAYISAFNQYMGGSFSGLIMQEIREFRSLAYSADGAVISPGLQNNPAYFYASLGCQADKTIEAFEVMNGLITNMPQKPERIADLKILLKNSASSYYPGFRYVSKYIDYYLEAGYTTLPEKAEFPMYDQLTFDNLYKFYESYIRNKPMIITVYGNGSKIDMKKLEKYGKIIELKKKDIFLE